jgi:hypothetical protein
MLGYHKRSTKIVKKYEALISSYPVKGSKLICNHGTWYKSKDFINAEYYGTGSDGVYEGVKVRLPEKCDEYLTALYGDWRTPPPPEKQKGHHYYEICDTEKPYTENPQESNEGIRVGDTSNAEKPITEKPITENPRQLNTNKLKKEKKNISNKEVLSLVEKRSDSFKEAWQGFVDMRKANKKPMTERAAKMILKKLDKLSGGDEETQIAILDKSVVKCWSDVYELKEQYGTSKQKKQPTQADYDEWIKELEEDEIKQG